MARAKMKLGIQGGAISAIVFVVILVGLTMVDGRVRDSVSDLFASGGISPFGDRLSDVGSALWASVRYQSIDNAPMLVFATVGTVLTVFMLRS